MKILLVSGFLGAGKTTFIQALSKKTGRDFVVYENEYSGASVDTKILEDDNLSVWESTENCVCCTGKTDFASSLIAIAASLDPEYLVVEPTGAAKLCSIIQNVDKYGYANFQLLSPVVIVDSINFQQQSATAPDIWADQVRGAGTIICSKTERCDVQDIDVLKAKVQEINTQATFISTPYESLSDDFFKSLLTRPLNENQAVQDISSEAQAAKEATMDSFSIQGVALPTPAHLAWLLDMSVMGAFGKIARAKGYLPCGTPNEWLKFDLVAREWAITGMSVPDSILKDPPTITFIGEQLERNILRKAFLNSSHSLQIQKGNKKSDFNIFNK